VIGKDDAARTVILPLPLAWFRWAEDTATGDPKGVAGIDALGAHEEIRAKALSYVLEYMDRFGSPRTYLPMTSTMQADDFRMGGDVPVRIAGSTVILPNPRKVPDLMDGFCRWLRHPAGLHPVALAGEAHYRLVTIHPFIDGNGRTARLLMNLLLLTHGYPPAIIRPRDRLAYLGALETAQLGGPRAAYDVLMVKAVNRSLDIYLHAVQGGPAGGRRRADSPRQSLLKIGQLAKAVGETVPTIRHWTALGLLAAAQISAGGYHLYSEEMLDRCRQIQALKARRLTLVEIRAALQHQ
jgi:hypothetical protein